MKKLLHLLAGLLFAVLPSKAQNGYTVDPNSVINDPTALKSGEYLIYCEASGKTPGFLFYKNDDNGRPFRFNNGISIATGYVSNAYYVWTVAEVEENGKKLYTFTNKQDNSKYLLKDNNWNQNMAISADKEKAKLEAVPYTDEIGVKTIALKLPEQITPPEGEANADPYIFCNAAGDPNLSYWGSDNPEGAVHFTFYPVSESSSLAPKYPFLLSDAPKGGQFAENTHWYYWTLRDKYASYVEGQDYISLSGTNPKGYGSFWAFVEKTDGVIEIYNAATGANKVLASTAPATGQENANGGNTYPTLTNKSALTQDLVGSWNIKTGDGCFYLRREGQAEEYYLNDRDSKIAFWTSAYSASDEGSQFRVAIINLEQEIATTKAEHKAAANMGAVGALTSEAFEEFNDLLSQGTVFGLSEAKKMAEDPSNFISLDANKYYRIYTQGRPEKNYMTMNADFLTGTDYNAANASLIWKFTGDATSGYTMNNQGRYAMQPQATEDNPTGSSQQALSTDDAQKANLFKLNKINGKVAKWGIKPDNAGLHLDANYDIVGWTNGDASEWYLVEAATIDLTITEAGYATVNYPFAVQVPAEVTAYTGTLSKDKAVFNLNEIENGIIPANTPVILQGAADTYNLTILTDNTDKPIENNDLNGICLSQEINDAADAYILGNKDSEVGFYLMDKTDRTLAANKAYIELPAAANPVRSIVIGGPTTGIEDTVAESTEAEEYYDLQGRRVMNPTKGIYVTKSGKKVLFNK